MSSGGSSAFQLEPDAIHEMISDRDQGLRALSDHGGIHGIARSLKTDVHAGRNDSPSQLEARKKYYGVNELPEQDEVTFFDLVKEALEDRMLQLLVVSAVVSLILGLTVPNHETGEVDYAHGWIEGTAILASVVLVTMVTSINNYQKEQKFKELSKSAPPTMVTVTRAGGRHEIKETDLLAGDVLHLVGGQIVPADSVLIKGQGFKIDESAETGENDDVEKNDADPFFRSGSNVVEGEGQVLVVGVGVNSYGGRIAMQVRAEKKDTPLQEALTELADNIGNLGMGAAGLMIVVLSSMELYQTLYLKTHALGYKKFLDVLTTAVTIVVVAVPEGLPLSVTIALAYSMKQMFKENNLVRHLAACETMGGATTICTDKTGTLTLNEMSVTKAWLNGDEVTLTGFKNEDSAALDRVFKKAGGKPLADLLIESISVNSTASKRRIQDPVTQQVVQKYHGNKTEIAMLQLVDKLHADPMAVRASFADRAHSYPFTSAKKRMTTCLRMSAAGPMRTHAKGASELVLADCMNVMIHGEVHPIGNALRKQLADTINTFARQRLRTIAIAYLDDPDTTIFPENDTAIGFTLLGLVGIEDPIRPEVEGAVAKCRNAGVTVRMVTGDNKATAISIAKKAGIFGKLYAGPFKGEQGLAIEGHLFRELAKSERKLNIILPRLQVLARASPLDKQILVEALMKRGEVVAVTGDGTNDAPALKNANVGFAMNSGTEVAKKASDVVILDDNFRTIVTAMKWGRNVNDNISKFIQFQTTVNVAAVFIAFIGAVFSGNGESPLKPVQLLWLNLIMDTMAALALATEGPTDAVLERPPRGRDAPLISRRMWVNIMGQSVYQIVLQLWLLHFGYKRFKVTKDSDMHMTVIFNVFVLLQVVNEFNARILDQKLNVLRGLSKAPMFLLIIVITLVVQVVGVTYGGSFMRTVPLSWGRWKLCAAVSIVPLPLGFLLRLIPVREAPLPDPEPVVDEGEDDEDAVFSGTPLDRFRDAVQKVITQLKVVGALASNASN